MTLLMERETAMVPRAREAIMEVEDLRVSFGPRPRKTVVDGISFRIARGECLALVGESGSGKSVTSRTLVGLTGYGSHVEATALRFAGEEMLGASDGRWRRIRGRRIGFVMQDALSSLDALRPVGHEIAEPLELHGTLTRKQRDAKVIELLTAVGVPEPELRARQYPHELSGGLRQRALVASAIACGPELLIADEPTTALDATIGAQVLRLLASLKTTETALLIISHDLSVVASIADRVAVMREGVIVEEGPTREILHAPSHAYTKALIAAVPSEASRGTRLSYAQTALGADEASPIASTDHAAAMRRQRTSRYPLHPLVEAEDLTKVFSGPDGEPRTVVSGVSFALSPGETLGIVGESGSGKTTTARLVLGLERPDGGVVRVRGRDWASLSAGDKRAERRRLQFIYQDPLSSFDPRWTVERIIDEALEVGGYDGAARRKRQDELLELVRMDRSFRARRPIEMSGGQRQRVAIARALASEPDVIVCDEPVSALDVSIQARILDLLEDLQEQLGVAYLFISHDLGVIHHVSDRVLVMKEGVVVESGDVEAVFRDPREHYTRALLDAIPRLGGGWKEVST